MSNLNPDRKILHIAEAARYLGIGRATLYDWIAAGQFPIARQINGRYYVTLADLEHWLGVRPSPTPPEGAPERPTVSTAPLDTRVGHHGRLAARREP